MRIIGPPAVAFDVVGDQLAELGANELFIREIFPAVWRAALDHFITPEGAVAQAYHETGAGLFGGRITAAWRNTCGLKIRPDQQKLFPGTTDGDQPLAHQLFPSWEIGAIAHVQHLRAYAGWAVEDRPIVDPRYDAVVGRFELIEFRDLGGRWAPSSAYGERIEDVARRLRGVEVGTGDR